MSPASFMLQTPTTPRRRPVRSATYHRLAAGPAKAGSCGAGRPTVLCTRASLLRRALRSIGCAI